MPCLASASLSDFVDLQHSHDTRLGSALPGPCEWRTNVRACIRTYVSFPGLRL